MKKRIKEKELIEITIDKIDKKNVYKNQPENKIL